MSLILHIESATAVCSVALSEGGRILVVRDSERPNSHGETMTRLIEACFQETGAGMGDLCAVALSAGPGSYTALRVGAATAKGICYALGKPLVRVDTLKAIAWAMREELDEPGLIFCPMIDARRMEVYTAIYDGQLEEMAPAQAMVVEPASFDAWMEEGKRLVFAGDGAQKCEPILSGTGKRFMDVSMSARNMVALAQAAFEAGRFEDTAYFSPFYLKPPNITQAVKKWWAEPG
jgi:tRNA threonylcarbamoyladenosine biosynthesis protein TsaB